MEIENNKPFLETQYDCYSQIKRNSSLERSILSNQKQIEINVMKYSISFTENNETQSTLTTALIICNNTLGTAVMILPLVLANCGIFTSLFIMIVIGIVQFTTCNLCVIHLKDEESDLPQIIERLLGVKWKVIYVISSIVLQLLVGIVFLILMNNMLYPIIIFIFEHVGYENYAEKSENRYDIYSFQINAWIFLIPCYLSCFIKKINFIATLSKIGIYVLCLYVIFLVYILLDNYLYGELYKNLNKISYFTSNITEVSGAFSMAFFIHPSICSLIKPIKRKEESTQALGLSYIFSAMFYFLIGIIGYFGILGRMSNDDHPQTIMDFFERDSILPFVIELLYFFKLATVYPIFCFVSKIQFLSMFYKESEEKHSLISFVFNSVYILLGMICVLFNFNLTFIIGFTAAVFGFLISYIIPTYFHMKCYNQSTGKEIKEESNILDNTHCNYHKDTFQYSKTMRSIFYGVLILPIGIYLMIIQLIALFELKWLK